MLVVEARVSTSTQKQALAALTFLYAHVLDQPLDRIDGIVPARRSTRVPVVLSQREVQAIMSELSDPAVRASTQHPSRSVADGWAPRPSTSPAP